jgi:hypothetical protein
MFISVFELLTITSFGLSSFDSNVHILNSIDDFDYITI